MKLFRRARVIDIWLENVHMTAPHDPFQRRLRVFFRASALHDQNTAGDGVPELLLSVADASTSAHRWAAELRGDDIRLCLTSQSANHPAVARPARLSGTRAARAPGKSYRRFSNTATRQESEWVKETVGQPGICEDRWNWHQASLKAPSPRGCAVVIHLGASLNLTAWAGPELISHVTVSAEPETFWQNARVLC